MIHTQHLATIRDYLHANAELWRVLTHYVNTTNNKDDASRACRDLFWQHDLYETPCGKPISASAIRYAMRLI